MSGTIRPKSENVARRVIDEVAESHGAKKKRIANNEFALSSRVRALEFEGEQLDVHTSDELKSQLAYARIVLRMPLH
jgi:hypothetical protein